jgi:hypothetical protein
LHNEVACLLFVLFVVVFVLFFFLQESGVLFGRSNNAVRLKTRKLEAKGVKKTKAAGDGRGESRSQYDNLCWHPPSIHPGEKPTIDRLVHV